MTQYELLGFVMPPGNWAQWFSGTASALAVATALFGYAFNEWRHRKDKRYSEEEDAAGLNFLLVRLLREAVDVYSLMNSGFQKFTLDGVRFEVDDAMKGVIFETVGDLDKSQLRLLTSYGRGDIISAVSLAVRVINQNNRGLTDYAALVDRFWECVRRDDVGNKSGTTVISALDLEQDTTSLARMCNQSRSHIKSEADRCVKLVVKAIQMFNDFVENELKSSIDFKVDISKLQVPE